MAALKHSRQREAIIENLRGRFDHPTADMVYTDIRRQFPTISLGTVYRNLSLLCEMGVIRKVPTDSGADRYDGNIRPHSHFVCRVCGAVQDIPYMDTAQIASTAAKDVGGRIEESTVFFYGTCRNCLAKAER